MFLFFDTETTGRPKSYSALHSNTENWPRMMQLGLQLYGDERNLIREYNILIRPPEGGFNIEPEAQRVHGITNEMCQEKGKPLLDVLLLFSGILNNSEYWIAHNFDFDRAIIGAESYRQFNKDIPYDQFAVHEICTMKKGIEICKLPKKNGRGYKWPKLQELHQELLNKGFEGAHDALSDVKATASCFWQMLDKRLIVV